MSNLKTRLALAVGVAVALQGLTGGTLRAEDLLREISWARLSREEKLSPGTRVGSGGHLEVDNTGPTLLTRTVLVLESPGVTQSRYAIKGKVRYEGVEGQGYLEMWSVFPDGGRYFSRTLERTGPMARLTGGSDWRGFALPFFMEKGTKGPLRLVVNVVLPGRGRVWLSPLRLLQYTAGEDPLAERGQWWSGTTGGLLGGLGGGILGCLGGLIGWLGSTGRARSLVLAMMKSFIALGVVALALGGMAFAASQPYVVYYPLMLIGLLLLAVSALGLPHLRKRYEEVELRKMRAVDVDMT